MDDSRSNLYADQLNRGFRGLRSFPNWSVTTGATCWRTASR
ncbi:hypothetical protein ACPA9J_31385 [Pseudomonas aeruginosa]